MAVEVPVYAELEVMRGRGPQLDLSYHDQYDLRKAHGTFDPEWVEPHRSFLAAYADRVSNGAEQLMDFGQRLFQALFGQGKIGDRWDNMRRVSRGRPVHLTIRFDDNTHVLAALPIELLFDPGPFGGYVFSQRGSAIVRTVLGLGPAAWQQPRRRPHILLAWACPPSAGAEFTGDAHLVRLRQLPPQRAEVGVLHRVTRAQLESRLDTGGVDYLAVLAHGWLVGQQTGVYLGDNDLDPVTGHDLALLVRNKGVGLVFLCSCHTARVAADSPTGIFSGVAQRVLSEVSCVVAMQAKLPIDLSAELLASFFSQLTDGLTPAEAVGQARRVYQQRSPWSVPVIYVRPRPLDPVRLVAAADASDPGDPTASIPPDDHAAQLLVQLTGAVVTELAAGLLQVVRQLLEWKPGTAPEESARVAEWLAAGPKSGPAVAAVERAAEEMDEATTGDGWRQVSAILNEAETNPAVPQLAAAAALAAGRESPDVVIPALLRHLGLHPAQKAPFVRFLARVRANLAREPGFADAIALADRLGDGREAAFPVWVATNLDHDTQIKANLASEVRSRRLEVDARKALASYLSHLRDHELKYSPLPLIRAGTQEKAAAGIKDIFVPISVQGQKTGRPSRGPRALRPEAAPTGSAQADAKSADAADEAKGAAAKERRPGKDAADQDSNLGAVVCGRRKIVLLGPPGGGKTTLLKRIGLALAEGRCEDVPGWPGDAPAVPVFLRLRGFAAYLRKHGGRFVEASPGSVLAYLEDHYREARRVTLTPGFFDTLLGGGGVAVLMDGLDEVPAAQREEVAQHVRAFVAQHEAPQASDEPVDRHAAIDPPRGNVFVLTSRPKGYELVAEILRPALFSVCEVQPLEPSGIRQLVANLLRFIEPDVPKRQADFDGLCDALFPSRDLTALAGNPMNCTCLVLVYKYRGSKLPQRRVDVLEEIVDFLLGFWKVQDKDQVAPGGVADDDPAWALHPDVKSAVKIKKRRLGHIALQMQLSGRRAEIDLATLTAILGEYLVKRERVPADHASIVAEQFLRVTHDRSNLLVETEPSIYAFTHEGFREYLVADALVNQRDTELARTVLANIDNSTWEEALLLAGSHPGLPDDSREYLLGECLAAADVCRAGGQHEKWTRRLVMIGRMARDMGEYLSPTDDTRVKKALAAGALDPAAALPQRIEVALALDQLGWRTPGLFALVPFVGPGGASCHIGKHLVTNCQYQRFVDAKDFLDPDLWNFVDVDRKTGPYLFDPDGREYPPESDRWLQANSAREKRQPKFWTDLKFGVSFGGLPVVGVNWYEAIAYCRWLERHWDHLEEAGENVGVRPVRVRLPTETEWTFAVYGGAAVDRLPWVGAGDPPVVDYRARANIGNADGRTTPVGMFPAGTSHPHGLADVCGNVWEWQANLFDHTYCAAAIRGGAFTTTTALLLLRGWRYLEDRENDIGFRILVEPADGSTHT